MIPVIVLMVVLVLVGLWFYDAYRYVAPTPEEETRREIDATLRFAERRMDALAEHHKRDLDLKEWGFKS